ncbi:T9SS type A sorting domain-containing protein [bacterium]|nr:T9SS type A sorting domain-containing protein [bacterium]
MHKIHFRKRSTLIAVGMIAFAIVYEAKAVHAQIQSKQDYVKVVSEKEGELVYTFNFIKPDIDRVELNGETHQRLTSPLFEYIQEEGAPQLPKISYLIELPEGSPQALVTQNEREYLPMQSIILNGANLPTDGSIQESPKQIVSKFNAAGGWYPRNLVELSYLGKMREIPLYRLTVYPYRYHATKHQVEFNKNMTVRITYSTSKKVQVYESNTSEINEILDSELINEKQAKKSRYLKNKTILKNSAEASLSNVTQSQGQSIKIIVNKNGIYKVTHDYLKEKAGLDFSGIDPRNFRLFNLGLEVPIYYRSQEKDKFSSGDYFEFYGEKYLAKFNKSLRDIPPSIGHYLDPWSDDNVYFLSWGEKPGIRLIEENGGVILPRKSDSLSSNQFTVTKHFEEDNIRLDIKNINLIQPAVVEDIWAFDGGVASLISSQSQKDYEFTIEKLSSSSLNQVLRINLQGISTNNHSVDIKINGIGLTTSLIWTGPVKFQVDIPITNISSNPLREGINTLTISTPVTSNPALLDKFALNWFEITYKRKYQAEKDYVEFRVGDESFTSLKEFKIEKFTDPDISLYKKGVSRIVNWDLKTNSGSQKDTSYFLVFQDEVSISGIEYIAVSESAKLLPKDVILDKPSVLASGYHNARYLIIAPKLLKDAALRLENYRRSKGLSVESVDIEDIYDEFNFGIKSPYAIRDFLRFTYLSPNWHGSQGSPLYIMLIGDASASPKAISNNNDFIPVQFIQTKTYGPAASDYWYSLADDQDILPDFFIGRFPVSNATQLDAVIDKIITYEQSNLSGSWKNKVLYIGGQSDNRGVVQNISSIPVDVFRFQATSIINSRMPQSFSPDRVYVFPIRDQFYGNFAQVVKGFEEGNLLTAYLGHGGGGIWGDLDSVSGKPLLNLTQVNELKTNPGRYPLVLSMTCFVGAFDNPNSLGELLLTKPYGGAVGVIASSGTGWIIGDFQLLDQSINAFLKPGNSVGEAVTQGKINYLLQQGITDYEVSGAGNTLTTGAVPQSMVFQFNYLGDPALRLKTPLKRMFSLSNYSPSKTSVITVSGAAGFSSGTGTAQIYQMRQVIDSVANGANKPSFVDLDTVDFLISNGSYSFNVNLGNIASSVLADGITGIRIFAESSDGRYSFNGQENFTINGAYISQIQVLPSTPTSSDTVRFSAVASDPDLVEFVTVTYDRTGSVTENVTDTLFLSQNNTYISRGSGPFTENDLISYRIKVKDSLGDSTISDVQEVRILAGLDLKMDQVNSPGDQTASIFLGGTNQTNINAVIQNVGFRPASNVKIRFYNGDPRAAGIFLGETDLTIDGSVPNAGKIAMDTVAIASTLSNGSHNVYVWIDPDSITSDVNRFNNLGFRALTLSTFNVTPAAGTTYDGIQNDSVSVDNSFFVNAPANAVNQNSTLSINRKTNILINDQPDLGFAYPKGYATPQAYDVSLSHPLVNSKSILVQFDYDTTLYPAAMLYHDSLDIYKWNSGNRKWNIVNSEKLIQNGTISVEVSEHVEIGIFTLMINRDRLAPVIEPTVEGQYFSQGSIAPKNPKISAIIYDRNGVSLNRKHYNIELNGQRLDSTKIILPDSLANSNVVTLTLINDQNFDAGANSITFQVSDVNGNVSAPDTLHFKVVSGFDIKVLGNFPNPFTNVTTFAFRIEASEQLDNLEIGIYTVSGRRIKKITPEDITSQILNSVGYHEVQWDATDDNGRDIANGIYFYRIKGKLNGKIVEKKGKLAYFR